MLAYNFPPSGGGGVQRTSKFVKYLRRFGWDPTVICARSPLGQPKDSSLLDDLPSDLRVYRTRAIHLRLWGGIPDWLGVNRKWFFHIPDDRIFWNPFALRIARRLLRKSDFDVVFTTSPPHSTHLMGLKLRKYGAPWVADFRDPWTGYAHQSYPTRLHRRIEENMERRVIETADAVVVTAPPLKEALSSRFSSLRDKIKLIRNGYDPEDLNVEPVRFERFTILYTGAMYGEYDPTAFALGFNRANRDEDMDFLHIGYRLPRFEQVFRGIPNTRHIYYVDHRDVVRYMKGADLLLLLIAPTREQDTWIPGKTYEYLASGVPILAVGAPDSSTADFLREMGGVIVSPPEPDAIADAILTFRGNQERFRRERRFDLIEQFSRERLTGMLARVFDSLT